jgi:cysteine synthase B
MESPLLTTVPGHALIDLIGHTPLLPLTGLDGVATGVEVLGKAEWSNPGGSVKDRAAWAMVRDGLESGAFDPGRQRLLDATSGNTGIAYAWIGGALGFGVTLCLPRNAGPERQRLLRALGAELVLTDPMEGTDGAIRAATAIKADEPSRWFHPDQYSNPANWGAHYHGTAGEIWAQTEGRITHFVAGIGTSGTLVGTSRRLRELNPAIEIVAFQPDGPYHALEGLKHLASAMIPAIYDAGVHDRMLEVSSDEAIDEARRQARRGLPLGWSAGAAVVAAARVARGLERGLVVTVLPDSAERYLGDALWEDAGEGREARC